MAILNRVRRAIWNRYLKCYRKLIFLITRIPHSRVKKKHISPILLDHDGLWLKTGFNFYLYYDQKSRILELEFNPFWEKVESDLICKNLNADSVFLDIGANVGYFSLMAAQRCHKVFSFEPTPYTFSLLEKNICKNEMQNKVQAVNKAIGDKPGTISFVNNLGSKNHVASSTREGSIDVDAISLDSFFEDKNEIINFIKVDIEGYEKHFVMGAENTIKRHKPMMLIEIEEHRLKPHQISAKEVFECLIAWGYSYIVVNEEGTHPSSTIDADTKKAHNFLFHQPSHQVST